MTKNLTADEVRVLGSLIEKDITTPDYYPLSLNALMNACNQRNNREPVTTLDEGAVRSALYSLEEKGLAGPAHGYDSRVTKYEHHLQEKFNLGRRETAVLCVLFLRGPQTPGELRSRSERMHRFEELSEVQLTLQRLGEHEPSLAKMLPLLPGTKEARYAHLLSGDVEALAQPAAFSKATAPEAENERIQQLEQEIASLRSEFDELKQQFVEFRKQFD